MRMQQSSEIGPSNEEMRPAVQPQPQPQKEKCPRCDSFNTKFCYYNNYSLSQPRYFCKSCRRYWTQGGTLRNVPIGGGCRKGKRPKTTSSSSAPLSQPSTETQRNTLPSANDPVMITASVSASGVVETGAFSSSCYPGGGYFPSMRSIQSLSQPPIFNQSVDMAGILQPAGVAVYSFGPEHNWSHQNFAGDPNPAVPDASMWTINDSTPSSAGNNNGTTKNSNSGNCLVPNPDQWSGDLPGYGHPP